MQNNVEGIKTKGTKFSERARTRSHKNSCDENRHSQREGQNSQVQEDRKMGWFRTSQGNYEHSSNAVIKQIKKLSR